MEGKLIICAEHGKEGAIMAFDSATGNRLWSIPWKASAWHGPGNPVTAHLVDRPVVVSPDGQIVAPADGRVLAVAPATCGLGSSPAVHGNRLFIPHGDYNAKPSPYLWIGDLAKAPPAAPAGPAEMETVRKVDLPRSEIRGSAPLVTDGLVFFSALKMARYLAFDAESSQPQDLIPAAQKVALTPLGGITLAGDRIHVWDDTGACHVFVIEQGKLRKTGTNYGPPVVAPPAFLGSDVFLRTKDAIVCIGRK
jgi:hypothetical protein